MGTCVLVTVKSYPVAAIMEGQKVTLYRRRTLCMEQDLTPSGFSHSKRRENTAALLNATCERVERAWGGYRPTFVVDEKEGGDLDGAYVFTDIPRVVQTDYSLGECVGRLRRNGNKWEVVSQEGN